MKQSKKLTKVLLIVYLLALTWIILFKLQVDFSSLRDMNYRSVNLIPFAGSGIVNGGVDVSEILLNIAAFVPSGIYVSMLKPDGGLWKKVLPIFCVNEVMQYILAIGGSDITDLIGNTLGGVAGIGVFAALYRLFGKKVIKVLNVLALIGTVAAVAFLALLVIANL